MLYWGVVVVPKTDYKIYVSISMGYIITFHLFSVLSQRSFICFVENIKSEVATWKIIIYAKVVENARINFSISPYRTLLFSRRENFKFFEIAFPVVLCIHVVGSIRNVWGTDIEILPILRRTFTCFLKNGHKNTQRRYKVCSNLSSVLQQLTFVLLVTFINFEYLSRPILVLLFKLWKGTCWLKVCRELFLKITQRC